MAGTKNLGQVAGLFIGTTPPDNTSLIWYDSTPSMQCHKVYSVTLGQWVVLDDNTILAVEYSVLRGRAQDPGLSVGQWFKITDKDNALALAITSTKVQYVDSIGNILIDDLSASIQYHVTHQNLLIDDVRGVFDTVNKRLVFEFSEVSAVNFLGDDYFLGERKVNNVWSLFKIKLSKLLSTTSGNTITWDNGFYLNFTSRFTALLDVTGGAVSKTTFDNTIASIRTDLANTASNQQAVAAQAAAAIAAAVTDNMIFGKSLPAAPDVSTGPADILEGDTLQMIVNKVQRWFNSLKWATGIGLSDDYAEATTDFNVSNNDSVESAIAKLAGHVRALQNGADNGTDNVTVSPEYDDAPTSDNGATAGSVLTRLLEKLRYYSIKHETTNGITLDDSYIPDNNTITAGSTNLTEVLEKFAYDLAETFSSSWRVPCYTILPYYRQPKYDNVIGTPIDANKRMAFNAGKGWFPCGFFFVGSADECDAEQAKWNALYGFGAIGWWRRPQGGNNYSLMMLTYHGISIPDLSHRFLSGLDAYEADSSLNTNSVGLTGGSNNHSITEQEMPRHTHGPGTLNASGSINYTYPSSLFGASGVFSQISDWSTNIKGTGSDDNWGKTANFNLAGNWSGTSEYKGGQSNSNVAENGKPIDIRPDFITVGFIIRLPL